MSPEDNAFAVSLATFIEAKFRSMDAALYPDPGERMMIAMSNAVSTVVKTARTILERHGMGREDAHKRALEMVQYGLGEDALFDPTSVTSGLS